MSMCSTHAVEPSLQELYNAEFKKAELLKTEFDKYNAAGDVRRATSVLEELSSIKAYRTPREIFSICKKVRKADCSLFKARVFENEGNAGAAMELYLRSGRTRDYVRLKALSGQDVNSDLNSAYFSKEDRAYYSGLYYLSKGDWSQAISYLSSKPSFNLFYSYLMLGELGKARSLLESYSEARDLNSVVDKMKMKAVMLYAENEQYKAEDILKELLKYFPKDPICLRYLAHIYYRTGWFDLAEDIYEGLISEEWRDTELYYLLYERTEMRVRYLMPEKSLKDVDRIIKEYPGRPDFIVQFISWLLEYGYVDMAEKYLDRITLGQNSYTDSLRYFAEGLIKEYGSRYPEALVSYSKAYELHSAPEYKDRAEAIKEAEKLSERNSKAPSLDCDNYSVKNRGAGWYLVQIKGTKQQWPVKYYARLEGGKLSVLLKLRFIYDNKMNFGDRGMLWSKSISSLWSYDKMDLKSVEVKGNDEDAISVNVVPWPSSFYLKRASSHEWSVLTPLRVIDHEAGHLLGLFDEYYETDARIRSRNVKRHVGEPGSIMRNMLSGTPQKRHIQFILSSLKCAK